jgi:hypothetical protein
MQSDHVLVPVLTKGGNAEGQTVQVNNAMMLTKLPQPPLPAILHRNTLEDLQENKDDPGYSNPSHDDVSGNAWQMSVQKLAC